MIDKYDKFKELAEKRVNNALKQIQLIGNLSNKSFYKYSNKDVEKIFKSLRDELKESHQRFYKAQRTESKFKF